MRRLRQKGRTAAQVKVQTRLRDLAASWVREHHPDVWQELTDEAYEYVGLGRRA